jgi:hypothetical protein
MVLISTFANHFYKIEDPVVVQYMDLVHALPHTVPAVNIPLILKIEKIAELTSMDFVPSPKCTLFRPKCENTYTV